MPVLLLLGALAVFAIGVVARARGYGRVSAATSRAGVIVMIIALALAVFLGLYLLIAQQFLPMPK